MFSRGNFMKIQSFFIVLIFSSIASAKNPSTDKNKWHMVAVYGETEE